MRIPQRIPLGGCGVHLREMREEEGMERFDFVTYFLLIPFLILVFVVGTVEKLRGVDVSVPLPLALLLMGALGLFLWAYWKRKFEVIA